MTDAAVSDRALAAQAAMGDEAAFRTLVRRVHPRIHRWALSVTGTAVDADEVAQEVLLRMYRHLGDFKGDSRLTTWLYRITRNAAIDHVRAAGRHETLSLDADDADGPGTPEPTTTPDPLRHLRAGRLAALVDVFFQELPDRQREVFDLVDLQGYAPTEVAAMLDTQPVTVRGNLFKARRAIRESILARHPELLEGYTP